MQPTSGILRIFKQISTPQQDSAFERCPRPAHLRLTQTVRPPVEKYKMLLNNAIAFELGIEFKKTFPFQRFLFRLSPNFKSQGFLSLRLFRSRILASKPHTPQLARRVLCPIKTNSSARPQLRRKVHEKHKCLPACAANASF